MTEDELEMLNDPEYHAWVEDNLEEARRAMDETSLLFVYGSLCPGGRNADLLASAEHLGDAHTSSSTFRMVSLSAFPAVVEQEQGGNHVSGNLFRVDPGILQVVDRLESEGEFYHRKLVSVVNEAGAEVDAWMYVLQNDLDSWLRFGNDADGRVSSYTHNGQVYQFWKNPSCLGQMFVGQQE